MAQSKSPDSLKAPDPVRQVAFHDLLVAARKTVLKDGLHDALSTVDPKAVKKEISQYVPAEAQKILAKAGVRDEEVFPTPTVLRERPTLVGYYRLLLGVSRKSFYTSESGMRPFEKMEDRGVISDRAEQLLPEFCQEMAKVLAELIARLSPEVTQRDVEELPLLTLGCQFQGSNNNRIGQAATVDVFLSIKEIVKGHVIQDGAQKIVVKNSAGRIVHISLAADPDVRIEEEFGDDLRKKVAIEIKGGTDRSNAHNRAGEAEKSHQKARQLGFRDFWTVIAKKGLDLQVLRSESPTTNSWFDVAHVLGRDGADWDDFKSRVAGEVGIPLN